MPRACHTEQTTLIIGTLRYAGVGWHNTGDAILADTSAAMARARQQAAREELAHQIGATRAIAETRQLRGYAGCGAPVRAAGGRFVNSCLGPGA